MLVEFLRSRLWVVIEAILQSHDRLSTEEPEKVEELFTTRKNASYQILCAGAESVSYASWLSLASAAALVAIQLWD